MTRRDLWTRAGGVIGDLLVISAGALFGLALRRGNAQKFLTRDAVLNALATPLAFTFAMGGASKAFSMGSMTEFFTQSGYSIQFLKFIAIAEILGGLGLLLPWSFAAAWIGLTVDMFGAVITHVHNADPLNDSTGALGMLIHLFALGVLVVLSRRTDGFGTVRKATSIMMATMIACFGVAIIGSVAVRHLNLITLLGS